MKLPPAVPKGSLMVLLITATFISVSAISQRPTQPDYVPNAETGVAVAEAVLIPIYGKKTVEGERPYKASLAGDVWTVGGTLKCPKGLECTGGAAVVELSKHDAHIISVIHEK